MPKDSEDAVESDEELEALKAELEKERAKYATKKPDEPAAVPPATPKTQPEPPPQAKPAEPRDAVQTRPEPTSDESLDVLRTELAKERLKYSLQATDGMNVQKPPEPDEELVNLEAELEKTSSKAQAAPRKPEPVKPAKDAASTPPKAETRPPAARDEVKAESAKHEQKADGKKELTWTGKPEPAKKPLPPELTPKPQEKKIKPALEPLHEDLFDDLQAEPNVRKAPRKTNFVVLVLLAALGVAAIAAYTLMQTPGVRESYQCLDGSWVADKTQCPTTTTTHAPATTLPPFTMPPTTTETATTIVKSACSKNSDCEKPIPYIPYCDDKYVKNPDIKFTCLHGGSPDAYCQTMSAPPKFIKACESSQYCWLGECYPEHCRNKARDAGKGEEKVDCGGPCRICNSTDTLCKADTDCGQDVCNTPYCNRDMNPTHNCTRNTCWNPGSPDATCQAKISVEVIEYCGRGRMCVEGQDDCMESSGTANCHDCVKNQGERGVDCGGPCQACTNIPSTHDTLNLTATAVIDYQRYQLKLDKLSREINCSTGAFVRATDQYGFARTYKVSAQNSAEFYDITFGFLSADTNSASIWIVRKNVI